MQPEHEPALRFWNTLPQGEALRVLIRVERHASKLKEIVQRKWLTGDPALHDLRILKMASETNYAIGSEHARRIEALWQNTGRDWNDEESLAGLWAFAHTKFGEVSLMPGNPVSDVALRIGRAVTGVYNKVMNFRHLDPSDSRAGLSGAGETDRKVWAMFYDAKSHGLDTARLDAEYARIWDGGSLLTSAEIEPREVEREPPERTRARVQGYEPDPAVRRAIEKWAMARAEAYYFGLGYNVKCTAASKPYDFKCTRDTVEVRVEVKGSRGDAAEVEVTVGEVENARGTAWRTDLFIVSQINASSCTGTSSTA